MKMIMKRSIIWMVALLATIIALPMQAGMKYVINGLQLDITSCTPYADGIVVNVTFTNTSGRDMAFKVNNYFEDQCYVIDENGDRHQLAQLIIAREGAAGSDFRSIPQDIPVKGQIYFRHVSDKDSMVKRMKLFCRVTKDGSGEQEKDLIVDNIPITPLQNTNMEGTKFTDPAVTMNTKGLTREGNNAILKFTLTNHDRDRYDAPVRQITAYDEEGNAYEGKCSIGYMKLETDQPQAFVITIGNVPTTVKEFSLIKAMFDEWGHKMEWRNIKISQ